MAENPGNFELVQALGREWRLGPLTADVKKEYATRLRMLAREALVEEVQAGLNPDLYRQNVSVLNQDIAAEKYRWDVRVGEAVRRSLDDYGGLERLTLLLLKLNHPEADEGLTQAIFDDNPDGVGLALKSLDLLGNRKPPAKPGATVAPATTA